MRRFQRIFALSALIIGLTVAASPEANANSRCWNSQHDHNVLFWTVETHYLLSSHSSYPNFYYQHYRNSSSSPVGYQTFQQVECATQNW